MGFTVTNNLPTSIGISQSNLWGMAVFNTSEMLLTGKVHCSVNFYISEEDKDAGKSNVYPLVDGNKVTSCVLQLQLTDVVKVGANCLLSDVVTFFYTKVKDNLASAYGWTIILD